MHSDEKVLHILSKCTLLLCVEGSMKALHAVIVLMIALPDGRQSLECSGVVFKRFTVFFTSLSLCLSVCPSLNGSLPQCVQ